MKLTTFTMEITFEKDYLKELYEVGRSKEKKYRFQPEIVKRYQAVIRILYASPTIENLWQFRSLNYEVLKGDKSGISSVRVNDQYRIEFVVSQKDSTPSVTVCNIIELSNHYR